MDTLLQDLRYGLRMLRSRPAFTVVALLALALGIGANTAMFSVVDAVLLRPLPYRDPGRLVMIWHEYAQMNLPKASLSVPSYLEYRDHVQGFESVAAAANWSANLTGAGDPERVQGARVTGNFLATLGVPPMLGRDFLKEEDAPGGERVVILSHGLWQRRFGGDAGILGKTLELNGETHTVVGVMPPHFVFFQPADLYKPIAFTVEQTAPGNHGNEFLIGVARLKPGVTLQQAGSEMDGIGSRLRKEFYVEGWSPRLFPLLDEMTGEVRPSLLVLLAAVGCVLLIACSNVANLLLARATARQREMAIRSALGAGRLRVVRQLLTESVVLGAAGGALGLLVAFLGLKVLVAAAPDAAVQMVLGGRTIGLDATALVFTLVVSILTGMVFGLAPALQTARLDFNSMLKEGGRGEGLGRRGHRLLGVFVVSQVAVALVLLVGAGLLIRSFVRLRAVDPGFRPDHVLTMRLTLPQSRYAEDGQVAAFFDELLRRASALPGVVSAATISNLPMGGDNASASFAIEGLQVQEGQPSPHGDSHVISHDYFRALGIPLVTGRFFEPRDGPEATKVAVIDQVLADRYWPAGDAVGHRMRLYFEGSDDKPVWREIVGVVGHVKKYGLDGRVKEQYYIPSTQMPRRGMTLVLRTATHPASMVPAARGAVRDLDGGLPVFRVETMEQVLDSTLVTRRFAMLLLGIFASVALVLAAVGLYGVISYSVAQRTREIGIRMALGARSGDVVRMVVRHGMKLTAIGLVLGAGAALAVTRFLASLLFAVQPNDLSTFLTIAAILAAVAWWASFLPARRASRIDPMRALREE
ncbi:MAG TPA: ABC transporter permease [Candidatus Polarisedimenticolia bacterium]|nr:ABC transporter permease [Candidatus Polarisedimenticolia bacterium]